MPYKKQECIVTTVDNRDLKEASIDLNVTPRNRKEDLKYNNSEQVNNLIVQIIKEFKQEKEKLLGSINEKKQDIQELLSKFESQNKIIKSLEETNTNFKNQIADFNNLMKENELILQNHKEEFKNVIELKDEEIKAINEKNLGLINEIESLNNSINEYKEKEIFLLNYKQEVSKIIEEKYKEFTNINEINTELKNKVNELQYSINECKDRIHNLKTQNILEEKNYYKNMNECENEIRDLKEKNEELVMNFNNKIYSLLMLLKEKEAVMEKLREMLKNECD